VHLSIRILVIRIVYYNGCDKILVVQPELFHVNRATLYSAPKLMSMHLGWRLGAFHNYVRNIDVGIPGRAATFRINLIITLPEFRVPLSRSTSSGGRYQYRSTSGKTDVLVLSDSQMTRTSLCGLISCQSSKFQVCTRRCLNFHTYWNSCGPAGNFGTTMLPTWVPDSYPQLAVWPSSHVLYHGSTLSLVLCADSAWWLPLF
jgi:hypothetical protein